MLETEFFPAQQSGSKHLMVIMHGLGDSSAGFHWVPQALNLPWMNYLLLNAPDPYYGGYSWYDFAGDADVGVKRSVKLVSELLDEQRAKGYPTEQTILSGFSQGCLMTIDVGCRYPHRFAGLVGISGYVHQPEQLIQAFSPVAKEQRFLITHGYRDPILPFEASKGMMMQLKAAGLNIEWREFMKAHTIAGEEELAVIRKFITDGYSQS